MLTYLGVEVSGAARVLEGQARVALLGHQHAAVVHLLELRGGRILKENVKGGCRSSLFGLASARTLGQFACTFADLEEHARGVELRDARCEGLGVPQRLVWVADSFVEGGNCDEI